MKYLPLVLLLLATPAVACPFLEEIKGECAPYSMSDKCAGMKDMRADPVCNAFGNYSANNYTAYVGGKLVPRKEIVSVTVTMSRDKR